MSTLHLLNDSPFTGSGLTTALLFADANDMLLLVGDAVYALQKDTVPCHLLAKSKLPIYALEEDVLARNLQSSLINTKLIGYSEFVELCTRHKRIVSW